jgi:hypothetical protein
MSDIHGIAQTAEIALVAATVKTILQIIAPANHRVKVKSWKVSFDGVSETAAPVECVLMRQTTAGTVTANTPLQKRPVSETIQVTAGDNASAEPTSSDIIDSMEVHPQSAYEKVWVPGDEPVIGGGGRLGIVCTAPANVNVRGAIEFEE